MKNIMHRFSKADKSETVDGWPDEAESIERTIEEVGKLCTDISKKIINGLYTGGIADQDKKLKKIPQAGVAAVLKDYGERLNGQNKMLSDVLDWSGKVTHRLSLETVTMEFGLEHEVASPLRRLADEDCPTLQALRKKLTKALIEDKTARDRLKTYEDAWGLSGEQSSLNPSGIPSTGGSTSFGIHESGSQLLAKVQSAGNLVDATSREVSTLSDQTLKEYYNFEAKENLYASNILNYLTQIERYHENCLQILKQEIPAIRKTIEHNQRSQTFGVPLLDHLEATGREIAYPIEICISVLNTRECMTEKGLFRIAGSKTKIDLIKSSLNVMRTDVAFLQSCGPAVAADALKQYIRYLPEPLLTYALYNDWVEAVSCPDKTELLNRLARCINKLPPGHRNNLSYLMQFFHKMTLYEEVNKMSSHNFSLVLPTILRSPPGAVNGTDSLNKNESMSGMLTSGPNNIVIDKLITYAPHLFPGDIFAEFTEDQRPPSVNSTLSHDSDLQSTDSNPTSSKTTSGHKRTGSQDLISSGTSATLSVSNSKQNKRQSSFFRVQRRGSEQNDNPKHVPPVTEKDEMSPGSQNRFKQNKKPAPPVPPMPPQITPLNNTPPSVSTQSQVKYAEGTSEADSSTMPKQMVVDHSVKDSESKKVKVMDNRPIKPPGPVLPVSTLQDKEISESKVPFTGQVCDPVVKPAQSNSPITQPPEAQRKQLPPQANPPDIPKKPRIPSFTGSAAASVQLPISESVADIPPPKPSRPAQVVAPSESPDTVPSSVPPKPMRPPQSSNNQGDVKASSDSQKQQPPPKPVLPPSGVTIVRTPSNSSQSSDVTPSITRPASQRTKTELTAPTTEYAVGISVSASQLPPSQPPKPSRPPSMVQPSTGMVLAETTKASCNDLDEDSEEATYF